MAEAVLLTGASSGIGEATAYAFAREKAELFLVARREDRLRRVSEACRQMGAGRVLFQKHDLSIPGAGQQIVQECLAGLGNLDILVCNAGFGIVGPTQEIPPQAMARIWQVNFQSGYESIYQALPHFLQQKRGYVVLVSSIIGKKGFPYSATYCATKFAQIGLGEALWGELKESGIGVTVVCPGYTATEFQQATERPRGKALRRSIAGQNPEVVARAIVAAVRRRRREIHLTLPGKLLLFIDRLSPSVATRLAAWTARQDYRSTLAPE